MKSIPFPSDATPRPVLADLERRFVQSPLAPLRSRRVVGQFLNWIDAPGARRVSVRAMDTLLFRAVRWGLDLDAQRWWFEHPRLAAGRFRLVPGRSRWRDTDVLQLHYDVSRLPIRAILYDEIKPLDDGTILGLGGLNAARGEGDHFFFALAPLSRAQ